MAFEVRQIPVTETHDLRHAVLRTGRPRHTCVFAGDEALGNLHFGLLEGGSLGPVAIVSLYPRESPLHLGRLAWQGRGMAVVPERQGEGLGSRLVRGVIALPQVQVRPLIWCNARISARGFYERLGFTALGEVFEVPKIGPHIVMIIEVGG